MTPLVSLRGLTITAGRHSLVRDVDLDIAPGETLGIIGESGSGKTVTFLSLLRLLPEALTARATAMLFRGTEMQTLDTAAFRSMRGRELAMVFQDPVGALNPAKTVAWHLRMIHKRRASSGNWHAVAQERLAAVGIRDPAGVLARYPHQLSGGMAQRVLIAMVLLLEPALIVADELTTNLDNIVSAQILDLFKALQASSSATFVFITHDIALAARFCHRIAVMYAGQLIEVGPAAAVLQRPAHPYTAGLIATSRALSSGSGELAEIAGQIPSPDALPPGCIFRPRCTVAIAGCGAPQPLRDRGGRADACVRHD